MTVRKSEAIELSIEDAARGWGVSTNTVRNFQGRLNVNVVNGVTRIPLSSYESTKVFRDHQLLSRPDVVAAGIAERDLTDALVAGAVKPSEGPDRRFSIEDERALLAWHAGTWGDGCTDASRQDDPGADELDTGPELPSPEVPEVLEAHGPAPGNGGTHPALIIATGTQPGAPTHLAEVKTAVTPRHWDELSLYIRTRDVGALETYFDDFETCPPFIPPANVFGYEHRGTTFKKNGSYTVLLRTAGYHLGEDGEIYAAPLQIIEEIGELPERFLPGQYARWNVEHGTYQREWERAWRHRRVAILRREGKGDSVDALEESSESHDLIEFERWYHDKRKRPEQAPDWVFCLPDPHPYLPRTNVARYFFGHWSYSVDGRAFTNIVRSEAWIADGLLRPRYFPEVLIDWEWGYVPFGSAPVRYAERNREAELDRRSWEIETDIRRKRRGL